MLVAKSKRVSNGSPEKQPIFVLELQDHMNAHGRATNIAMPLRWEGLCALKELLTEMVEKRSVSHTVRERPEGTNKFYGVETE